MKYRVKLAVVHSSKNASFTQPICFLSSSRNESLETHYKASTLMQDNHGSCNSAVLAQSQGPLTTLYKPGCLCSKNGSISETFSWLTDSHQTVANWYRSIQLHTKINETASSIWQAVTWPSSSRCCLSLCVSYLLTAVTTAQQTHGKDSFYLTVWGSNPSRWEHHGNRQLLSYGRVLW